MRIDYYLGIVQWVERYIWDVEVARSSRAIQTVSLFSKIEWWNDSSAIALVSLFSLKQSGIQDGFSSTLS